MVSNPSDYCVKTLLFRVACLQDLGEGMTGITGCAKAGDLDHFCDSVRKFATAVCGLTENSAQVCPETQEINCHACNIQVNCCFEELT